MKLIADGMKLGVVGFVGILTFNVLNDGWKLFWGSLAKWAENKTKKEKDFSIWDDSVNAEVGDDGK